MQPLFPVALKLAGRRCIVVGAETDREAIEREAALWDCGADVVRIDPESVTEDDVAGAFFVISTPMDSALSARLREYADRHRVLLCCIDQPQYGFVAMTAVADAGPVRIAISTSGQSPAIAKRLREGLQTAMDAVFVRFVEAVAGKRAQASSRDANLEAVEGFEAHLTLTYPQWFNDDPRR